MAITLKRKRGAVSYKEPSSDISEEEIPTDSDRDDTPRRKRTVPQRRSTRSRLIEQSSSSASSRPTRRDAYVVSTSTSATTKLRGMPKLSYREPITDEEDSDGDEDFELEEVATRQRTPRTRTRATPLPHALKEKKARRRPTNRPFGAPLKRRSTPQQVAQPPRDILSDGIIPDWDLLPYHVLLQIFIYSAHPLHDENMVPTKSIPWLVQMACVCHAFTKPALTALYRDPPIFAVKQNRAALVRHLISQPSEGYINYPVTVKRLALDATKMSSLTDPTHSAADLVALVTSLTTLKDLDIFDPIDKPPYRSRLKSIRRWHYPIELFEALRHSNVRLRSWRWNSIFCPQGPLWMKEVHTQVAFQSLREITFTKFHPKPSRKSDDDIVEPTSEELIGSALAALPNLRSLMFENCLIANDTLLPLLPDNLTSLNITNCINITSDALQEFLVMHGRRLEELVLNHDQSLGLSFLVDLKQTCPRLEVLRMDMTYFSSLAMSSDNEPLWDELLKEGEIPSWPSTLRVIELENLRNWISTEGATSFFSSLIDSAEDLPWLRELTILTMVDIDWRRRAEFRKKWTARFQEVFAKNAAPPNPNLMSLRAYREWKTPPDAEEKTMVEKNDSFFEDEPQKAAKVYTEESDSDVPLLPSRKQNETWNARRLRTRGKAVGSCDVSSDEESAADDDDGRSDSQEPTFIQGKCHTVIFRIDNLRPREHKFDEGDFLDEEASGDEDWTGNDTVEDGYAW
ncbi:hypothetical protein K504DRAFT_429172 [Pleomassaria siparia CBS 279.74]|uniref:Uncharacterized protein n=1 Tax=Pleomassaria siparia CBS 279.74 TaxID=1314801 RepID=A0A6G1KDA3_9PLEO|nr:hypothetical protein K504DRAFT_429172 [Pleomassaria siparia CBS 279.74]